MATAERFVSISPLIESILSPEGLEVKVPPIRVGVGVTIPLVPSQ